MVHNGVSSASGAQGDGGAARAGFGFLVKVEDAPPLFCREVRGFHRAAVAAVDPEVTPPSQLILIGLDDAARAWIEAWAEDTDRVRRTITIRRLLDDREATAVVTLASYGYRVETALAVESIAGASSEGQATILRSGVHSKADIDAMLALLERRGATPDIGLESVLSVPSAASVPEGDDAGWFIHV